MFGTSNRHDPPAPDGTASGPSARFRVLIGLDGGATVDGEHLRASEGETVHVAVLDALHRRALTAGRSVEAWILDRRDEQTVLIEVAADGSSRMLGRQPYDDPPAPAPAPAPHRRAEQTAGSSGVVSAVPPSVPPSGVTVPDELAALVAVIGRSVDDGQLERAGALAFRLREHSARVFGEDHSYTLEALALEAFVAHRGDNHRLAASTSLRLARVRQLRGDPRSREDLSRAVAAWGRLDDVPSAVGLGQELLDVWSLCVRHSGPTAADAELMRLVNRRLHTLSTRAATPEHGAA
ncbi:hypothetical protein [Streptomyces sp. NPDC047061]|uniref:hypothetical protein n=1 Tax=Streptomyces sp. NPDC047061 TaxID=3154605 RepID=UPI0033F8D811